MNISEDDKLQAVGIAWIEHSVARLAGVEIGICTSPEHDEHWPVVGVRVRYRIAGELVIGHRCPRHGGDPMRAVRL